MIVSLAFVLATFGFSLSPRVTHAVDETTAGVSKNAVLGVTRTGVLVWVAEALGYFDDVPIELKLYQSGTQTVKDLVAGEIQLATSSHFAFISLALDTPDLRMIATLSSSRTAKLLSRRDTVGNEPSDLRGKRIGVTRKSAAEYFLWEYLILNGLEMEDVTLVDLSPIEIVDRIENGELDAALTWEPHASAAGKKLGSLTRWYPDQADQYYYFSLNASSQWLEENESLAKEVLQALLKAEAYARQNPEETQNLIASIYDMPLLQVRNLWLEHTLRVELPQDLVSIMENSAKWRIDEGLATIKNIPNVLELIDDRPLEASNASAVQIIK